MISVPCLNARVDGRTRMVDVHIIAHCPKCHSQYQLEPTMVGQVTRCPNTLCRTVFKVQAEGETGSNGATASGPNPTDGAPGGSKDSVFTRVETDDIQLVEAEPADPPAVEALPSTAANARDILLEAEHEGTYAIEGPSWAKGPPPARKPPAEINPVPVVVAPPPTPPREVPKPKSRTAPVVPPPPPPKQEGPREVSWNGVQAPPPPVRSAPPIRTAPSPPPAPPPVEPPPAPRVEKTAPTPPPADDTVVDEAAAHRRRARRLIGGILSVLVALGGAAGWFVFKTFRQTEEQLYTAALADFEGGYYPRSKDKWTQLRERFPDSQNKAEHQFYLELVDASALIDTAQPDPPLGLARLDDFRERHAADPLLEKRRAHLVTLYKKIVEDLFNDVENELNRASLSLLPQAGRGQGALDKGFDSGAFDDRVAKAAATLVRKENHKKLMEILKASLGPNVTAQAVRNARREVANFGRTQPELRTDPQVVEVLKQLDTAMAGRMKYERSPKEPEIPDPEEGKTNLYLAPSRGKTAGLLRADAERVVCALARGILYGLDAQTGDIRWATRVGIDATTLPTRLPGPPEMVLVVAADGNSATAYELSTGKPRWRQEIPSPSQGRPLVVRDRVLIPTREGRIFEIDAIGGRRLGWYEVPGEVFTVGGAYQSVVDGDTSRDFLFFPGLGYLIYIIDFDPDSTNEFKPNFSVLRSGHPEGSLRNAPVVAQGNVSFLILNQADGLDYQKFRAYRLPLQGPETELASEYRVRGWSWFPPVQDAEKLGVVTDAGVIGLYGITQAQNLDEPFFPEVRRTDSEPGNFPLASLLGVQQTRLERAEVVHAAEPDDWWVLAEGSLGRFHFDRFRQTIRKVWSEPGLGSPLHQSQFDPIDNSMVVVSQTDGRPICLATCVDAEHGRIRWQRQLGLTPEGEPLQLGTDVYILDRAGSLLWFDVAAERREPQVILSLAELPETPPVLLPGPDDSILVVASYRMDKGVRLAVHRFQKGKSVGGPTSYPLPKGIAGRPAWVGDSLILPLADDSLLRRPLEASANPYLGPTGVRGDVVPLGGDEFLTTDGRREIKRWSWPAALQLPMPNGTYTARRRIATSPTVMPGGSIAFAEVDGSVTLLNDKLQNQRHWQPGVEGKVTGMSTLGQGLVVVVERRSILRLNPAQEVPVWKFTLNDDIVGQPRAIGDVLMLATAGGRVLALDPATGKEAGKPFEIPSNVAAAGSPVAFDKERVFLPLADGSVLVLPLAHFGGVKPQARKDP